MEVISYTDEHVVVRTVPSPFTEADVERRHDERMTKLREQFGQDLWRTPFEAMMDARGEMSGDYREMAGCDRVEGKPLPGVRRTLPFAKLAERWNISVEDEGWRGRVLTRVRESAHVGG